MEQSIWARRRGTRVGRRPFLAAGLAGGAGLSAAFLAACGGSNNNKNNAAKVATNAPSVASATRPAGTAAPSTAGTAAAGPAASAAARPSASAAAAGSPAAAQPKRGGHAAFHAGLGEPPNLDIFGTNNYYLHILGAGAAYSRLIKSKTGVDVPPLAAIAVPDVAESWEQPDDQTYVFHLRKGVKFHNIAPVNGRELVAQDVVYSYNRELQSPAIKSYLGTTDQISAGDNYTVTLHSKQPNADFLLDLVDGHNKIAAHEAVELKGDLKNGPTIGSGAWVSKDWIPNTTASFTRNPNYFLSGLPYPDEFEWLRIPDVSTWEAAFRTKRVLDFQAAPKQMKQLQSDIQGIKVLKSQRFSIYHFLAQSKNPPLNDLRVRQALSKSINRQEVIDTLYDGSGWIYSGTAVPGPDWLLPDDETKKLLGYDPTGAKQLLQAAGQPSPTISTEVQNLGATTQPVYELMQAQLKQVGFNAQTKGLIENETWNNYLLNGGFQSLIFGILASGSTTSDLLSRYHTGGSQAGGLSDPDLDAMIEKQATLVKDEAGRRKLILDIQRRIIDQALVIPGMSSIQLTAIHPFVLGWAVPNLVWEYGEMDPVWLDQ